MSLVSPWYENKNIKVILTQVFFLAVEAVADPEGAWTPSPPPSPFFKYPMKMK